MRRRVQSFPCPTTFPPARASSNVVPSLTHDLPSLRYLCDRPDFCSRLHLYGVELGMKLQSQTFDLLSTPDGLFQTFNSLNQNPCTVAAYLESTCNSGCECFSPRMSIPISSFKAFTIAALWPGYAYSAWSLDYYPDLCSCNTVIYSLISACVACQGGTWDT
jgi:hypothetical protein